MSIDSQRIQLRPIQVEDAIPVYGWTGDPLVTQPLFWDHHPNINFTVDFLKTIATRERCGPPFSAHLRQLREKNTWSAGPLH